MFRALVSPGVPVACVDDLETYGLLTSVAAEQKRAKLLNRFAQTYAPLVGNRRGHVLFGTNRA